MNLYIKGAILCIIVLLVGITIGLGIGNLPYVTFSPNISIGEVTNLILVLFVAVYIPFFLNKQINNKRIEKDIHIQSCNILRDELYKLRDLIESAHIANIYIKKKLAERILLRMRNISCILDLLIKDCILSYKPSREIKDVTNALISNNIDYWKDLSLNLKDEKPQITIDTYIRAEGQLNKYLSNISKLKMLINGV